MIEAASVYMGRHESLGPHKLLSTGKVRDIYEVDAKHLLFVTSDRVSAFDVVMPRGVPHKGRVLNTIAAHWFGLTGDIIPNHLVSTRVEDFGLGDQALENELRGRTMLVRRCEPTSVEWVIRGYIAGSGWKEYQSSGTVCGIPLPAGLEFCGVLPEPILTPTTKDDDHDLPLTPDEARERVGSELFEKARDASMALFARGTEKLAEHGILLADTKFEFGMCEGELILIDEALTPDSSRFWPADQYATGKNQPSYDKQILRDHLETLDWDKNPPGPELEDSLIEQIAQRYLELCKTLTGSAPEGVNS